MFGISSLISFVRLILFTVAYFYEVTEVLDDGVSASGRCPGDSDGEI